MKVKMSMIHPSLRGAARWMRLMPLMGKAAMRFCNAMMKLFYAGHAHTKAADYKQEYALRPDGSKLRLCVYTPKARAEKEGKLPGVLWIHGGGYALGIPEQDVGFIETLMNAKHAVFVAPDYQKSCKKCYPAALDDCYLALQWLYDHAEEYGIDPQKLMVGGDSAGGGLTAAVCLYARDRGEIPIAFQMPLYPMLDCRKTPSSTDNNIPGWNSRQNDAAWKLYLGESLSRGEVSKYASPALEHDYHGLPPMFSFVSRIEPFYNETVNYAQNLRKAGVGVNLIVVDGCFHGFDALVPKSPISVRMRKELARQFAYAAEHYTARDADFARVKRAAEQIWKK